MRNRRSGGWILGALVLGLTLAPGPQEPGGAPRPGTAAADGERAAPTRAELARSRAEAANRAVELAWVYYSENRINADTFYRWSQRAREAERDAATDAAGRLAAAEHHQDRMRQLEAKVARIRNLGFGNSLDVAEVVYYVREAEWLREEARGGGG